jgi:DNA-binding SARP family transcriptional activator
MLQVSLFGRLSIRSDEQVFERAENTKPLELLCYLLVYRDRPHPREKIASLLWDNTSTERSKKNLRQTLWQLQSTLTPFCQTCDTPLLLVEPEWLQLNEQARLALDVREFERAYALTHDTNGQQLLPLQVQLIENALELYRGNLLDGWYQDWCLFERERLQNMYLSMLDKMMGYCELYQRFEQGISYGVQILRYDRAHERTYANLMRLHYQAGDRTAALHQYERCVAALREELSVEPSRQTSELYELVMQDRLEPVLKREQARPAASSEIKTQPLRMALEQMYQLQGFLEKFHHQLEDRIHTVEHALHSRGH